MLGVMPVILAMQQPHDVTLGGSVYTIWMTITVMWMLCCCMATEVISTDLPYTEHVNETCLYDIVTNPGYYCHPGYFWTANEIGRKCRPCPFDKNGTQTHQQYNSNCEKCVICPGCPTGFEVDVPCTRKEKTKCRPVANVTTPSTPEGGINITDGLGNSSAGPQSNNLEDVNRNTTTVNPESEEHNGETAQPWKTLFWSSFTITMIFAVTTVLLVIRICSREKDCCGWMRKRKAATASNNTNQEPANNNPECVPMVDNQRRNGTDAVGGNADTQV